MERVVAVWIIRVERVVAVRIIREIRVISSHDTPSSHTLLSPVALPKSKSFFLGCGNRRLRSLEATKRDRGFRDRDAGRARRLRGERAVVSC